MSTPRKLPCICGHGRSYHRYIYYGKLLSVRSPCNKCGRKHWIREDGRGVVAENKCMYYKAMDNLDYVEWLAKRKHLV